MKELKVGDFCFVNGEGSDVFLIVGEDETSFEVMAAHTGTCFESKYKCHYVDEEKVVIHTRVRWTVSDDIEYKYG
jgi:hypothetical protein